jgi:hypothetical protein
MCNSKNINGEHGKQHTLCVCHNIVSIHVSLQQKQHLSMYRYHIEHHCWSLEQAEDGLS